MIWLIDLISRQMVLDVLNDFSNRPVHTVKGIIAELPSVTSCEDAISRTKAIEEIRIYRMKDSNDPDIKAFNDGIDTAISVIGHNVPLIAPSRPKGHWIDDGYYADNSNKSVWRCSKCDHHIIEYNMEGYKFCPNCGADMRGDDNESGD